MELFLIVGMSQVNESKLTFQGAGRVFVQTFLYAGLNKAMIWLTEANLAPTVSNVEL